MNAPFFFCRNIKSLRKNRRDKFYLYSKLFSCFSQSYAIRETMVSLKITSNCNMSIRKMQEVLQKNAVLNGKISAYFSKIVIMPVLIRQLSRQKRLLKQ